ncbi:hypothetical protein COO91_07628 [Nostoc flagelliforme CCNUN1]|uniref:Uncharacterized protein n=1 Tax=Nostoc flagelliforme CCNUN1 TaxID=2038116 RepID=A0A2K8T1S8_9NOSO|nr:hypothetical protein COO91_07628 [Nostoc flagelliforme CCNUN1]
MINSVHLSGLGLSALNFSSGRDVGECETFTLTKPYKEKGFNFSPNPCNEACSLVKLFRNFTDYRRILVPIPHTQYRDLRLLGIL